MRIFQRKGRASAPVERATRLHIGAGQESIAGWINIDSKRLPGVDRVLDVRKGLPFSGVASIYAEHFIEHLTLDEGLAFLAECRRVLAPEGVLRLSTPNLDWVMLTHYRGPGAEERDAQADCFRLNRAFHAWGHRFLYNRATLCAAVRSAGFGATVFRTYGESDRPEFSGLERHQTWEDTPELPHVLIVEASGRARGGGLDEKELREFRRDFGSK